MASINRIDGEELERYALFIPEGVLQGYERLRIYGLEDEGVACGIMMFAEMGKALELVHFDLLPQFAGQALFDTELIFTFMALHDEGFKSISANYFENEMEIYKEVTSLPGFEFEDSGRVNFNFTMGEADSEVLDHRRMRHIKRLSKLSEGLRAVLYNNIKNAGIILVKLPLDEKKYLMDHSLVYMENGEPLGLILLREMGKNVIHVDLFYMGSKNIMAPIELLGGAYKNLKVNFPDKTRIRAFSRNRFLTGIIEKSSNVQAEREVNAFMDLDEEFYYAE